MKCARLKCEKTARSHGLCRAHLESASRLNVITTGTTDAGRARKHLLWLYDNGIHYSEIMRATAVSWPTQKRIRNGTARFIYRTTEQRLLNFRPESRRRHFRNHVPGVGTTRRLRALVAIGYSQRDLAVRLGLSPTNFSRFVADKPWVHQDTHDAVAALFNALQLTSGPSDMARKRAARNGWALPLQWDEDTIDDPSAGPCSIPPGRTPFPERLAELEYLHIPRSEMPRWLGIEDESFERQLSRHQLKEAV